ncbi:hypothetical protein ACFLVF_01770 [Chloroflexota bacterium]
MKKKFSSMLRVMLALVMLTAFGAVVNTPVSAQESLTVDVNAFIKTGMLIEPHIPITANCLEAGDVFYINAAVTAGQSTCTDVIATISIIGPASLHSAEVAEKSLGNIPGCNLEDVWWKLQCDGPGSVEIVVDVTSQNQGTAQNSTFVNQCSPESCPVLEVRIIECPGLDEAQFPFDNPIDVSTVFGVKAMIDWGECERDVSNVTANITIEGPASLVDGMPPSFNLGDMEPGDEYEVGWTLHCDGPGKVLITIDADFDGEECDEVTPDTCEVLQEIPACLVVEIINPAEGDEICANCGDVYTVDVEITNPCDVDADFVLVKLQTVPEDDPTVDITTSNTQYVGTIPAGGMVPLSWDFTCEEEGPVTFIVTADGEDAESTDPIHHDDTVTIEQVPWTVDITTPETSTTFSTLQEFNVSVDVKNCSGFDPAVGDVTISWEPASGAILAPQSLPVTQDLVDMCNCCEDTFEWTLICQEPGDLTITTTVATDCCADASDEVVVHQEQKVHLVAGVETYYQCCEDELMVPISTFDPGQIFHVVVPVCNTGAAKALGVMVDLQVSGGNAIILNPGSQTIPEIAGGDCEKVFWTAECIAPGPAEFLATIPLQVAMDENTGTYVLDDNICDPCSITVQQIDVSHTVIQPLSSTTFVPGTFFTVKAEFCNEDLDIDLQGVTVELFWTGNASLAEGQPKIVPIETLLGGDPGECAEATWEMQCDDFGDVEFWFCLTSTEPAMCITFDGETIHQEVEPTCLEIDIISPDMGSYYATSQEYAVTTVITNITEFAAYDVEVSLEGIGIEVLEAVGYVAVIDEYDAVVTIPMIPGDESATITWTVHCTSSGMTPITANVGWYNWTTLPPPTPTPLECDWCDEPGYVSDLLIVWQYPAAHLEVDITDVLPDTTITVCDEFEVIFSVSNTGEADASEVMATLSVTPEGSARPVEGLDSGYTKYIGTLPGHGQDLPYDGVWAMHCKVACESTIVIDAEGYDEYGWHLKQHNGATGSFIATDGFMRTEELDSDASGTRGWKYGVLVGDANGLFGAFSFDSDSSVAVMGGGPPDFLGHDSGSGFVSRGAPEDIDLNGLTVNAGDDVLFFVAHYTSDAPTDPANQIIDWVVNDGLVQVINGNLMASVNFTGLSGEWQMSYLNGTYVSNMAAQAGLPIQDRFIEADQVTVKQMPSNSDLAVTKTADGSTFDVGQVATYTVTIMNNGPSDATNVKVEDVLPAGINFDNSIASQGYYYVMSGIWDVGDLAEGASATLTVEATVNTAGDIVNCATVLASDSHDPDTANNTDCVTITGIPGPPADGWCCQLDDGVNLISLPLIPTTSDPAVMLATVDFSQAAMYVADGEDWWYYNDAAPSDPEFLFADGQGYFIIMDTAGELCFDGYEISAPGEVGMPPSYDVVTGWNLVGFKSTTPKLPSEYLAGIAGKYVMIYGFADGAYFIAGSPGHEYLQPCQGYWVAVVDAGTIYP